ncbi:hypothetical protein RF11_04699 [Thelohanellus kitauei]|uniref:Uncharacterized protein n=1 Tax=Thelohanellus kitauei TaxID=669202 RepID=A0A0C2NH27_THEKT|nr:hypothetical protein RF11_04699 [Thelohanellus kitauei]
MESLYGKLETTLRTHGKLIKRFPEARSLAVYYVENTRLTPYYAELNADLNAPSCFFYHCKLQFEPSKTSTSLFYHNNNEANTSLSIGANIYIFKTKPIQKHLGVFLDRTLSFKKHIIETGKKISHRNSRFCKLANNSWRDSPYILRLSGLDQYFRIRKHCMVQLFIWKGLPLNSRSLKSRRVQLIAIKLPSLPGSHLQTDQFLSKEIPRNLMQSVYLCGALYNDLKSKLGTANSTLCRCGLIQTPLHISDECQLSKF